MRLGVKKVGWFLAGLLLFGGLAQAETPEFVSGADGASPLLVWTKLQSDLEHERLVISACRADIEGCTNSAARRFIAIIEEGARYDDRARIAHINRAANLAIRSMTKPTPNWTSPLAALTAGAGDCKQFAMLKYAALLESGFKAEHLRILVVEDKARRATHAVVAAREGNQWLVLNNRTSTLAAVDDFLSQQALLWTLDRAASAEFLPRLERTPGS
jgi:predicted transglutaminase-like cysteine proteinase